MDFGLLLLKDSTYILFLLTKLILFFLNQFYRYLIVGLGHILFKKYFTMKDFQPALDVLQTKAYIAFIELVKIVLRNTSPIMMQADKELFAAGVLGEVYKAGVAVLEDIVNELLYDPENDQLIFGLQPFAIVMEAGAGVHATGAADLLEEVVDGGFQPEVLEGGGHKTMRDIANELDGVVDDLLGIVNALQLGGLVQIDQVLIEIESGGGEQGAGVIVEVGGNTLAFFFLQADRGIQQQFLLILLHALEAQLVAYHLTLVKNNENDEPDGKCEHTNGAKI